ncbi:hypothetical protein MCOR04_008990 [Pyricularia oryzae]|nr:hypothetical protein MCOR04_008990 [Pyricularia oryzae]
MPSCSPCCAKGVISCQVFFQDFARYVECVRSNRSGCDVLGLSAAQIRYIGRQHSKLDAEVEALKEQIYAQQAKLFRLRKQKKLWFEKIMRAIFRGIDNLEELDRVERKEAEQEERRRLAEVLPEISLKSLFPDSNFVWDSTFPMGPLNSFLLDKMNAFAQHLVRLVVWFRILIGP